MGKKVAIGIFTGIALIGLAVMVVGIALGGRPSISWIAPEWTEEGGYVFSTSRGEAYDLEAPAASQIDKVNIDISVGYVWIRTGDVPRLTIEGPLECTSHVENGEWQITSIQDNLPGWGKSVNRPWLYWLDGVDRSTIYNIVVPETVSDITVNFNMGEMHATDLTLDNASFSTNMGSMAVDGVAAKDASFSTDMGSVDVRRFEGENCRLDVNMGNINFSGNVTDTLHADCDMGNIKIAVPKPETYSWSAEADMGSVQIDGHAQRGLSGTNYGGSANAKPYFDLSCGMGSIEVLFT